MRSKSIGEKKDGARSHRNRISIVDEDESVRQAMDRFCRSAGYESRCFNSAKAYLAAKWDEHCDCLILDLQLPGMIGLDLYAEFGAHKRAIPVVMITACEDKAARRQASEAGVIAFLRKPFHTDRLLDALKKALDSA
jgi:FixJ family two-component response regulator